MISLFAFSCANPESVKADAKRQLEKRYGEKFDILSYTEIVLEKPRYDMTACPQDNPSYVFQLSMSKKSGMVMDNYVGMHWVYEASDELKKYLKLRNQKVAALVEPRLAYLQTVDDRNIPSFNEALKHQQPEDYLVVTVYFFKDYNDSTKSEIFDEIRNVVDYYNTKGTLSVRYEFEFYDEEFFKNINTDSQQYSFQGRIFHYPKSFETTYLKKNKHFLSLEHLLNQELPDDAFLEENMVDCSAF
jgi:hypothetical protein